MSTKEEEILSAVDVLSEEVDRNIGDRVEQTAERLGISEYELWRRICEELKSVHE